MPWPPAGVEHPSADADSERLRAATIQAVTPKDDPRELTFMGSPWEEMVTGSS